LSFAVWWLYFSQTAFISPYSLPYIADDPLTYKKREYKTEEDVWSQVNDIAEVNARTKRSIGQDLYHLVPLFTNPDYILDNWQYDMINEYNLCKNFNLPIANTLYEADFFTIQCFSIIQNEFNAIAEYNKDNG